MSNLNNVDFFNQIKKLTFHHKKNCKIYSDYVDSLFFDKWLSIKDIPYIPVTAFKEFDIFSVPKESLYKTMYSSGTTGLQSKIYLDKETAKSQSSHLVQSFKSNFGGSRFPMLVIDSEETARGNTARTAAVNGFSLYGKKRCFALNKNMELQVDSITKFMEEHSNSIIFIFGFTFIIYKYFIKELERLGVSFNFSNAFVLHGGGWKKLSNLDIKDAEFKRMIESTIGCKKVHNYYGMIEQTGSIYFECDNGNLHAPHNGAVLIRNFDTFEVNPYGTKGLIQVFSNIQKSYPGHSLLTEDIGSAYPGNTCPCGRKGDIIKIHGRLEKAEIRGCSDAI